MIYRLRIEKAQNLLEELQVEAVIATSPSNFFYFSGTWLDSHERLQAIVIPKVGTPIMIVHEMSKEEIYSTDHFEAVFWKDGQNSLDLLADYLTENGSIAIDTMWPSENLIQLMDLNKNLSFVSSTEVIGTLRLHKDEKEIEYLRKSGAIADKVITQVIKYIRPGMTEKDVTDELKRLFSAEGVEQLSFNPIVGAGKNGAIPHHQSDETTISAGDMVVIDMGGVKDHYCSDMTRTIVVGGEATSDMRKVYNIVQRAQEEAVKAIKPGIPLKEIDRVARDIITNEGYGPYFTHRTGHGIGIQVHEEPYVTSVNDQVLEEGMVISVEPGIYLSGQFGVRIEDIVVVTSNGSKRLNQTSRDLIQAMN